MPVNTLGWNLVRYTLLAPPYDRVAGYGRSAGAPSTSSGSASSPG
jgi:hypothetical protein